MISTNSRIYVKEPDHPPLAGLSSPLVWGVIGGFAGTLAMDLILMAALWLAGSEPLSCFSMVGMTVRRLLGLPAGEGLTAVMAGVATHYSVGPTVGFVFGALMRRVGAFRSAPLKRTLVIAALYVELISQPMLVTVPVYLELPLPRILLWYAGSTVMHLICAVVLGVVVWHGRRRFGTRPTSAKRR